MSGCLPRHFVPQDSDGLFFVACRSSRRTKLTCNVHVEEATDDPVDVDCKLCMRSVVFKKARDVRLEIADASIVRLAVRHGAGERVDWRLRLELLRVLEMSPDWEDESELPEALRGKRCEVCGGQAFTMVQDVTRVHRRGSTHVEYERDGAVHQFCLAHERDSRTQEVTLND